MTHIVPRRINPLTRFTRVGQYIRAVDTRENPETRLHPSKLRCDELRMTALIIKLEGLFLLL
jgi:hypothetical protein